jgi:hypothetical protein
LRQTAVWTRLQFASKQPSLIKVTVDKSINIKIMAVKNFMVYIKTNFGADAQKQKTRLQFASKQPSLIKVTVDKSINVNYMFGVAGPDQG